MSACTSERLTGTLAGSMATLFFNYLQRHSLALKKSIHVGHPGKKNSNDCGLKLQPQLHVAYSFTHLGAKLENLLCPWCTCPRSIVSVFLTEKLETFLTNPPVLFCCRTRAEGLGARAPASSLRLCVESQTNLKYHAGGSGLWIR